MEGWRTVQVEPLHGRLASFLCDSRRAGPAGDRAARNLHAVKPLTGAPRLALSCGGAQHSSWAPAPRLVLRLGGRPVPPGGRAGRAALSPFKGATCREGAVGMGLDGGSSWDMGTLSGWPRRSRPSEMSDVFERARRPESRIGPY